LPNPSTAAKRTTMNRVLTSFLLVGVPLASGCIPQQAPRTSARITTTTEAVRTTAAEVARPTVESARLLPKAAEEARPMGERLGIVPRELPSAQDERDADDRFRLAKAFYNGKNYQSAKEVLTFLLGEYGDTKIASQAQKLVTAPELMVIDVPAYVRKPRQAVVRAEGPSPKGVVPESEPTPEKVYERPTTQEAPGVVFLPSRHESGLVNVRGYTRKDGTYVRPYTRHSPRR
jgi:hypothetical protein